MSRCVFCRIVRGEEQSWEVARRGGVLVILDHRPLLHGHCLVLPEAHVPTLHELPHADLEPLFSEVQLVSRAVERALEADGSFTAVNVKVSQSVPHLHVHVVPRWQGDGLFSPKMVWKRRPYRNEQQALETAAKVAQALEELRA